MDESACLVRSFSNPVDASREVKEGEPIHDPIRVLTESVSFGRFMSESLAWEKWSTFSHNRYLEEVEKFSKPGSVAQKKAFFEAHYKRRAAMRDAALLEQTNIVTNDASQMGTINSASVQPSLNTDLADSNASLAVNQPGKDVSDAEIADTAGVVAGNLNVARENDVIDVEQGPTVMEEDVNMEECQQVENSKAFKNGDIHDKIMATPTIPPKKCDGPKNSTSSSKKRGTNSLSKSSTPGRASKSPLHPSKRLASGQTRNDADVAKSNGSSNDKKKTMPNVLHMSINFSSSAGKTKKTSVRMSRDSATPPQTPTRALKKAADQENLAPSSEKRQSNSTSKLCNNGGISKQVTSRIGNKSNNHAYMNKKPALDSNEQRRITQKSLHMSMNFTRHAGETTKTSPRISRESSTPLQTPTREKAKNDPKRFRQSTDVKAKSNEDSSHASQIPHNYVKKITSSWPQSPKLGKPSHSTVQNANSRPPRGASINSESSKNGLMKNSRISRTALPKNRHENASPNIQISVGKVGIPYKHDNRATENNVVGR
ncbi:hypothetical protein V6N11_067584 [Hibiscus sabdariffa]|uniref:TPX2 C-terminal domain-containing protein n=1 Tax=Hibiscus sabdariffa TaxID=183260 RepID=A0ABR2SRB0_9ROSI